MLTSVQSGNGVDIEIHTESVAQLIGHELGIDARLTGETGMRAAHDLKRGPVELDRLQPRRNEPSPTAQRPILGGGDKALSGLFNAGMLLP